MTFLSPAFLWLLPLITLPVIIHLLAKRRSKLIEFPSLKFLRLLEQDALRKFNVKQLLLLIIRTLIILLIILAFSRPNLDVRKGFRLNTKAVDLMIIAIDNTASNQANLEEMMGTWLTSFSSDLQEKGFIVRFTGITDFILVEDIFEIEPGYGAVFSGNILEKVSDQIDLERYRQKSIMWLGDGQDAQNNLETLIGWDKFVLLSTPEHDGGISSIEMPTRGLRLSEEYQLTVGLITTQDIQEPLSVKLAINDKRQNQATVHVEQNFIEMTARVIDAGFQEGEVTLGYDKYSFNDIRYFVIPAAGSIPVQILRRAQGLDYWSVMKQSIEDLDLNVDLRLLDYSEIDNLDLSRGGTVVVEDASLLVEYNWNRLEIFVKQGGQLILFGDGGEYMRNLLGFSNPLLEESSRYPLGLYAVDDIDTQILGDPIKAAILGNRLKIYKRYDLGAGELGRTWIRFLDDQPFLGATQLLDGRLVWFNTQFHPQAGNLPLLGIFPTLMVQLIQSQDLQDMTRQYNSEIGDTLHFNPQANEGENTPFSIQRPDGTVDYQAPDSLYSIHYSATNLPGVYRLMRGRQSLERVAVNISVHEAQAHGRVYEYSEPDIFVTDEKTSLVREVLDRRSGIALWPLILSILLILWVVETYLSRIKSTWRKNV